MKLPFHQGNIGTSDEEINQAHQSLMKKWREGKLTKKEAKEYFSAIKDEMRQRIWDY